MHKSSICFIIPPSPFLTDERVFMSLGILKIAAVVEKEYDVDVLDFSGISNFDEAMEDYLNINNTNIFGITLTTPQLPAAMVIIEKIRSQKPSSKIILGGPHITLIHTAYLKEKMIGKTGRALDAYIGLEKIADVLVAGDGEKAIFDALQPDSPKIINADDTKSQLYLTNNDFNTLPWPARKFVDVDSYHYFIDGERALSLVSQLGCPFECGFCGGRNSPSMRRMRSREPENVVAEMEHLYKTYGVKGFMFYDDELNVKELSMIKLMTLVTDLQKKLNVEFRLRGFVKSQLFNDSQAKIMYKAGFRWILSGFESSSPEILRNMNKKSTVEENTKCVEIAHRHGLKIKALMSLGHPGESEKTALATKDWLLSVRPDDFDITIITVYPGTPYHDQATHVRDDVWVYTKNGAKLYSINIDYQKVANFYKGNSEEGYQSFVYTDFLSQKDIVFLRDKIERDVREQLRIPFPENITIKHYEHSMGQSMLPQVILKTNTAQR